MSVSTISSAVKAWLISLFLLLVGLFMLAMFVLNLLHGATPEADLLTVEGPARDVAVSSKTSRRGATTETLRFRVGDVATQYSSASTNYEQVARAVASGRPLRLRYEAKPRGWAIDDGTKALYGLSVDDRPVLTYADVSGNKTNDLWFMFGLGLVMTVIGGFALRGCIRRTRDAAPPSPPGFGYPSS